MDEGEVSGRSKHGISQPPSQTTKIINITGCKTSASNETLPLQIAVDGNDCLPYLRLLISELPVKVPSNFLRIFIGYVVMGSNGEFPLMTAAERVELVRRVRRLAAPDRLVLAGPACEGTAATLELCHAMAEAGADAVMVINPSYYKASMTEAALAAHFEAVADGSPVPVVLYSLPANTGIDLSAPLLTGLAHHPNVIGLKDSGGDVTKIARVVHETRDLNFQVLAGSTGFLLPAMLVGCVGGVNGLANILGAEVCRLHQLAAEGRYADALELHRTLLAPNALVTRELGVPAMKAAMDLVGLYGGPCRRPLLPLTPDQQQRVRQAFAKAGFL